ncbi:1-(5-phosphoribosyl)-5-[(5-phosphoribosylamino)methylideneamino]imidazole-4-carboxamide isomerase [Aristophania vespae]|uniref:1-(5-phosphoribosyl)-5-[(5- phosphoribosylamino)methylideneamino]imidazole-4- carboxamide isomerase n=1 Tax=Aristophania vespae TaxID=2697033 RepID=UPI0023514E38|nr:1-(5-phosphoribosyl)-5-[(5-phosphoribosylamino)methylideneamino]imidazole-4-carboxamide isomerase [Aristophania vespae]UMM63724.1 Imidazole glycerol phosphate synthase subunit HisF [Aristophania vespae]
MPYSKLIHRVTKPLSEEDLQTLIDATMAAILDGGTFGWLEPPERPVLERFFKGMLLVPEREFFVARTPDGTICGSGILALPPAHLDLHNLKSRIQGFYIAPYARSEGYGQALLNAMLDRARALKIKVVDCELRETQKIAIDLLIRLGFEHWGTHPYYARTGKKVVRGLFFSKYLVKDEPLTYWQAPQNVSSSLSCPIDAPIMRPKLTLYPAIDLKNGACVRLKQGNMDQAIQYSDNPAAQAKIFSEAGCKHLHVVDLDGAFAGHSANSDAIKKIIEHTSLPIQLGGGLRDMASIERWLEAGISRVILGSAAVKNPELVKQASKQWPGKIVAGIDARHGCVATEGWAEASELTAIELAKRMEDAGVAAIIFTEITRDGMLEGLDLEQTAALARKVSIPVIASGGVGSLDHLKALYRTAREVPGIAGVIIGKAIYDGRIDLTEALKLLEGSC